MAHDTEEAEGGRGEGEAAGEGGDESGPVGGGGKENGTEGEEEIRRGADSGVEVEESGGERGEAAEETRLDEVAMKTSAEGWRREAAAA